MKILITGGAGFIGSHLCDALTGQGHQVTALDNLVLGRVKNIAHLKKCKNFNFVKGNILDMRFMQDFFNINYFDMVFHLAANSDIRKGAEDPFMDCNNTFHTTFNILQFMRMHGIKKIVFASTSAIYGETTDLLTEDYGPLQPVSVYGAGKLASEAFLSAFSANYGIQTWITRFPNVVGERFTHGVIYDFIRKLRKNAAELEVLGNGEQYKPYMYVKDLVQGILYVWQNTSERFNVYNLGVESRTRVSEIAQMVIEEMGLGATIRYTGGDRGWQGDVPEFRYDLSKVHALGWKAQYTSNEAVRLAIKKALSEKK